MRLLICLLLLLVLAAPALADDTWDADPVMHKGGAKDRKPKGDKPAKGDKQSKDKSADDDHPLGMYFGNGDEFLESGAPESASPPEAEEQDPAEPDTSAPVEPEQSPVEDHRSAILGPHHMPPAFAEPTAAEAETEASTVDALEPEAVTEPETVTPAADETVSQLSEEFAAPVEPEAAIDDETSTDTADLTLAEEPDAPAANEESVEPDMADASEAAEEADSPDSAEPALAAEAAVAPGDAAESAEEEPAAADEPGVDDSDDLHEDHTLTPQAGLSHYSTYPQIKGKGKSKKTVKPKAEPADDNGEPETGSSDGTAKPKRKGGIKMYDPDTW